MLTDTERLSSLIDNILEASGADPKGSEVAFSAGEIKPFLDEVMEGISGALLKKEYRSISKFRIVHPCNWTSGL